MSDPTSESYWAGDDITLEFTVTDQDDDAIDITAMTARFVMARRVGDTPVISTEADPVTATADITDGANGIFQILVDGEDTAGLFGTYVFQAEVEDVSGDKATVAEGFITFKPDLIA